MISGMTAFLAAVGGTSLICYLQRQRFWDGYGWRVRNVRVCN